METPPEPTDPEKKVLSPIVLHTYGAFIVTEVTKPRQPNDRDTFLDGLNHG